MYRKKEKDAFNCFEDGTVNIETSTSIHTYLYGFLTKIKLLIMFTAGPLICIFIQEI